MKWSYAHLFCLAMTVCLPRYNYGQSQNPKELFTFKVDKNTPAAQLNTAVDTAFMRAYRPTVSTDYSISQHELYDRSFFTLDDAIGPCTKGYLMYIQIIENGDADFPRIEDQFFYFALKDNKYTVWNTELSLEGSREDVDVSNDVDLSYSLNDVCPLIGIRITTKIPTAGVEVNDLVTLYAWSSRLHTLLPVIEVPIEKVYFDHDLGHPVNYQWNLEFIKDKGKPFAIEMQASGDSVFTEHYQWRNGKYEKLK